jgi:hypothetical protein
MANPLETFQSFFGFNRGIKTSKTSLVRAYTEFEDKSVNNQSILAQFDIGKGGEMSLSTKSCFKTPDSVIHTYANNNILQVNYTQILQALQKKPKFVRSQYTRTAKKIEQSLKEVGFDNKFIETCAYEMYLGNELYLYITEVDGKPKLSARQRYANGIEITKPLFDNLGELRMIQIGDDKVPIESVYVLYNTKVGKAYYSNLKLAIPFIKLKNQLLDHNLDNATSGLGFKTLFSFDPSQIQGMDAATVALLTANLENVKKQLKSLIESKNKAEYLPFEVKAQALQANNAQNQTNFLLNYCDEQIQICSYSNGSMSGRDGTANRAVSTQDRDNFDQTTVTFFVERIKAIVNEFLIPQLVSNPEDFVFEFYSEDTDETFKKREQSLKALEVITSPNFVALLDKTNLKVKEQSIIDTLKITHGIELVPKDQVETTSVVEKTQEGFVARSKEFSIVRAVKESEINTIKYNQWINQKSVFNIIEKYKKVLNKVYGQSQEDNLVRAKFDIRFADFMNIEEFTTLLSNLSQTVVKATNDLFSVEYTELPQNAVEFITETAKLHFEGGEIKDYDTEGNKTTTTYQGFDNTLKNQIESAKVIDQSFIDEAVKVNIQSFKNNIAIKLFNKTFHGSAIRAGANFVGTLGKLDNNIRDHHRNNSGYAWEIGKNPPDASNRLFYLERWCRCSRVYGTKQQLEDSGFTIYEQL